MLIFINCHCREMEILAKFAGSLQITSHNKFLLKCNNFSTAVHGRHTHGTREKIQRFTSVTVYRVITGY